VGFHAEPRLGTTKVDESTGTPPKVGFYAKPRLGNNKQQTMSRVMTSMIKNYSRTLKEFRELNTYHYLNTLIYCSCVKV
jgi:hypothetical protein